MGCWQARGSTCTPVGRSVSRQQWNMCQVEVLVVKHQLSTQPGWPSELHLLMLGATGTALEGPSMAHTRT